MAESQLTNQLDDLKKAIKEAEDMLEQYRQKKIGKDEAKAFISKYQQLLSDVEETYDDVDDKGDEVEELLDMAQ